MTKLTIDFKWFWILILLAVIQCEAKKEDMAKTQQKVSLPLIKIVKSILKERKSANKVIYLPTSMLSLMPPSKYMQGMFNYNSGGEGKNNAGTTQPNVGKENGRLKESQKNNDYDGENENEYEQSVFQYSDDTTPNYGGNEDQQQENGGYDENQDNVQDVEGENNYENVESYNENENYGNGDNSLYDESSDNGNSNFGEGNYGDNNSNFGEDNSNYEANNNNDGESNSNYGNSNSNSGENNSNYGNGNSNGDGSNNNFGNSISINGDSNNNYNMNGDSDNTYKNANDGSNNNYKNADANNNYKNKNNDIDHWAMVQSNYVHQQPINNKYLDTLYRGFVIKFLMDKYKFKSTLPYQ